MSRQAAGALNLVARHPCVTRHMPGRQEQAAEQQQEKAAVHHAAGQTSTVQQTVKPPPFQQNDQHPGHAAQRPIKNPRTVQSRHAQHIGGARNHLPGII